MGQAYSHSALGLVGGRLALKLRRRRHMTPVATPARSGCREGYDPPGAGLHIPQPLCPVCSVWAIVQYAWFWGNSFSRFPGRPTSLGG